MTATVGISGTRRALTLDEQIRVCGIISALPRSTRLVVGACVGIDTLVALYAILLGYHVHAVVPADRSRVDPRWRRLCTSYEEMPPGTDYRARDTRVVELSDRLIAFPAHDEPDPRSRRSGTWMTIRIARRAGKPTQVEILEEVTV